MNTFRQCPKKFSFQYLERLKVQSKESIEMFAGKKVHESLEQLYLEKENGKTWNEKELCDDFEKRWKMDFQPQTILITRKNEEHFKEWGKKCLMQYHENNQPFDDGHTIGVEKSILFQLGENGPKWRGVIDRLVLKEDTHLQIHDYKTHSKLPARKWFDTNEQLPLYQIWAVKEFPRMEKIELVWHFVGLNQVVLRQFEKEQLDQMEATIVSQAKQIDQTKRFMPNKGSHCAYCAFKPHCPAFNKEAKKTLFDFA